MEPTKRKLTIPEIQKRLREMGKKAQLQQQKSVLKKATYPIKKTPNLPVPWYNQG